MFRAILPNALLVVALLFTQHGAFAHAIEHTLAEQSQDQSLPHHQHCDLCAVYAQIGNAIGSSAIHIDFAVLFEPDVADYSTASQSVAFIAFAARAPPCSA